MLFMEIYGSLGNANVINIYLQHVSKWPSCPRFASEIKLLHQLEKKKEKYRVIQNLLCSARAHNYDFLGGRILCHISGGFLTPPPQSPPFSLNISLYVCLSLDEGAASRAALLSYRSVSLEYVNCSTDQLSRDLFNASSQSIVEIYFGIRSLPSSKPGNICLLQFKREGSQTLFMLGSYGSYRVIEYENIEGWQHIYCFHTALHKRRVSMPPPSPFSLLFVWPV